MPSDIRLVLNNSEIKETLKPNSLRDDTKYQTIKKNGELTQVWKKPS